MKKKFAIPLYTILVLIVLFGGFIAWLTVTDFNPPLIEPAETTSGQAAKAGDTLTIFDWNIGYGGLGESMDFFMDGGTGVRASEKQYRENWQGISNIISSTHSDMYFIQEIDRKSTRSYKQDQYADLGRILSDYSRAFATNYKVKYIPSPTILGTQYGSVYSGLALYSRYPIDRAERVSLPGNYKWPKKIFFLDRCMLVVSMKNSEGKEIVLINTHNSAYDKGGHLRKEQLEFIKSYAGKKYADGAYVIIGGDWNSYMPGTDGKTFPSQDNIPDFYQPLPSDWEMSGWNWAVGTNVPTNRSLAEPYREGKTFTAIIDGFLLSPNIELVNIQVKNLHFRFSDHNPLLLTVRLK